MSRQALEHTDLGTDNQVNQPRPQRKWELTARKDGKRLVFEFSVQPLGSSFPATFKGSAEADRPKTKHLNIKVGDEDCFIIIQLDRNIDWSWHPSRAITTEKDRTKDYLNLRYWNGTTWVPGPYEGSKRVGFTALTRPNDKPDEIPFNMNILLDAGTEEFLPITVDPDIQNPGTQDI